MDLNKIISELRAELQSINEVLSVLDRLARTRQKRRGRPPLFLLESLDLGGARGKRRPFSDETRKKMAAAQKKRWAAYRKAQKQQPAAE